MAKLGRLTARKVETAGPGKYGDGGNLYLIVSPTGARKWVLRFMRNRKAEEMGLGSATTVTLSEARDRALQARRDIERGLDPRAQRKRTGGIPTFLEMADEVREAISVGFRNEKHKAQWKSTLAIYAKPLHAKPVNEIGVEDVLTVLKPIWTEKPETASRVRGRIEKVLDAAKAKGHRDGENPARWRGHLDHLLPKPLKLTRGHHAAMDYENIPAFIGRLREREAIAALAMEFCILTATRSGEVLGARWSEFDMDKALWTIPAERMKAGRQHRIPLCARALEIIKGLSNAGAKPFVFPGNRLNKPLSAMAMEMVLRRMKIDDATVHGFRSSFRDWAGNVSNFPREVLEAALAHIVGDKAEQAYRRSDALEKRQKLMDAWANYCEPRKGSTVVALGKGKGS